MLEHYQDLINELQNTELQAWADVIAEQVASGLSEQRFGDLTEWKKALYALPKVSSEFTDLKNGVFIGENGDCSPEIQQEIHDRLADLIPWRKGPFHVHGTHIDTEWRSDWKWDRVLPHILPLKNKTVLDVGCGSGYHCWRMYGEGAKRVIGIDPSPRFVVQFEMIKHFIGKVPVHVLPIPMEAVPSELNAFDTVFSMGVLYHRRSPFDHIKELRDALKNGGQLVLETLVVDGKFGYSLVPEKRYAMMNNVWFIPTPETLASWLKKMGFNSIELVDLNETSFEEQRQTPWMKFHSLEQFLDPNDHSKTAEGHPRPKRAVFTAIK
ncbi:tRNA 5-methoxyuridine(34)/uridine 5-oxyacetic acid(34) synthase CmoB [Sessilibacter sp. MAH1]